MPLSSIFEVLQLLGEVDNYFNTSETSLKQKHGVEILHAVHVGSLPPYDGFVNQKVTCNIFPIMGMDPSIFLLILVAKWTASDRVV
nr:4798_t:CDS:2 [Entrophospora candida]